jgi:hypothetical protein
MKRLVAEASQPGATVDELLPWPYGERPPETAYRNSSNMVIVPVWIWAGRNLMASGSRTLRRRWSEMFKKRVVTKVSEPGVTVTHHYQTSLTSPPHKLLLDISVSTHTLAETVS